MKRTNILLLILKLTVAVILLQTLFFKFTGAEESIFIFSTLNMEPWGRIGSGVVELLAVILLLIPKTTWVGAILASGSMAGAIFFHFTRLGIEVQEDGRLLFALACTALAASLVILYVEYKRKRIPLRMLYSTQKPKAPSV